MSIKILTKEEVLLENIRSLRFFIAGVQMAFVDRDIEFSVLDRIQYEIDIYYDDLLELFEEKND